MGDSLEDFIAEQDKWLDGWLSSFGWTRDSLEVLMFQWVSIF